MIVADTNLLAYLLLGGTGTPAAQAVFLRDPVWTAPLLWRSEFRSILAGYLRRRELRIDDAIKVQQKAEALLAGREHVVPSERVLKLVASSTCSAYDCEFVALADQLSVPLVTLDRAVLREFPVVAISPSRFAPRGV
ncbi:MAG: type II toxin-antitoxin system VapC family toxin [Bacillati bacterium ANGP1]|uniref:Type II toxin-antitoxin system VapC family toxin n=1 Tax=Candidatus Segetimicrobium genomatis TaxID=2569760 RepID=A0A537IWV3_9BACT|nr:MAG: type II toxin-antitoxin system VapC family toxin [Terrabacteria group bacterium ANGP1]